MACDASLGGPIRGLSYETNLLELFDSIDPGLLHDPSVIGSFVAGLSEGNKHQPVPSMTWVINETALF
jgi:hypothetical protein